ncbi:MAG: hypothetical protein KC431_28360, partial [Myxococcales bacterium]|nr:hypothetical protein [Myxococcales bacterium]
GAIPHVAGEVLAQNHRWRQMVAAVKSVQTYSVQVWLNRSLAELGWSDPSPLLSLYHPPLNTWADMSQVIESENTSAALGVRNISYFTGPQPGPEHTPKPADDPGFAKRAQEDARVTAEAFLRDKLGELLPRMSREGDPLEAYRTGAEGFETQYVRANCEPSDRCTLALPGSTCYRMRPEDTGYENFVVTGDWTDNGIDLACIEGSVRSGILAARALTGVHIPIIGDALQDLFPGARRPPGAQTG